MYDIRTEYTQGEPNVYAWIVAVVLCTAHNFNQGETAPKNHNHENEHDVRKRGQL